MGWYFEERERMTARVQGQILRLLHSKRGLHEGLTPADRGGSAQVLLLPRGINHFFFVCCSRGEGPCARQGGFFHAPARTTAGDTIS